MSNDVIRLEFVKRQQHSVLSQRKTNERHTQTDTLRTCDVCVHLKFYVNCQEALYVALVGVCCCLIPLTSYLHIMLMSRKSTQVSLSQSRNVSTHVAATTLRIVAKSSVFI